MRWSLLTTGFMLMLVSTILLVLRLEAPAEYIVYFVDDGDKGDLYRMQPDGQHPELVRQDVGYTVRPQWSPDGQWIAYSHVEPKNSGIMMLSPDGRNSIRVTESLNDASPAWSPDNQHIAFVRYTSLNRVRTNGQEMETMSDLSVNQDPSFSPDSQRIAFSASPNGQVDSLYLMETDGTGLTRLDTGNCAVRNPAWSPDGEWIAFSCLCGDTNICKIQPDGGKLTRLTDGWGYGNPSWSPDSQWLIFTARHENPAGDIYRMRPDGSEVTRLTDSAQRKTNPVWSPTVNLDWHDLSLLIFGLFLFGGGWITKLHKT
jgi:TolB protein